MLIIVAPPREMPQVQLSRTLDGGGREATSAARIAPAPKTLGRKEEPQDLSVQAKLGPVDRRVLSVLQSLLVVLACRGSGVQTVVEVLDCLASCKTVVLAGL